MIKSNIEIAQQIHNIVPEILYHSNLIKDEIKRNKLFWK